MNRVMSEVLPTDCSPRKTSLNFLRAACAKPSFVVAVWGVEAPGSWESIVVALEVEVSV